MPNQDIKRVSSNIQTAIKSFCKSRLQSNNELFFIGDLTRYVSNFPGVKCAPASPDRILRNMRKNGTVNYVVANRSKSLYKVVGVAA